MAVQYKVVYRLSNSAIFNDLEQPLTFVVKVTLFFDAEHLKSAKGTAIVTINYE